MALPVRGHSYIYPQSYRTGCGWLRARPALGFGGLLYQHPLYTDLLHARSLSALSPSLTHSQLSHKYNFEIQCPLLTLSYFFFLEPLILIYTTMEYLSGMPNEPKRDISVDYSPKPS